MYPRFILQRTLQLAHCGDCALLGVDSACRVAVEEIYGDWLAQHLYNSDGTLIESRDEQDGANPDFRPFTMSDDSVVPPKVERAVILNYTAGRWRGLREEDRITEIVQPLSVSEKMALTPYRIPGSILGIAESYVLAEAALTPGLLLVCRRVRIAHAVALQRDADGLPYDYDTYTLHLTQWLEPTADDAPLDQGIIKLAERPMDLLFEGQRLYVADGGDPISMRASALHTFTVE